MFLEPERTPYDWEFRLFGIVVRVNPWFWLACALISWNFIQLGIQYVLLSMVCVFASILLHELGHVVTGMLFGSRGYIILYGFGGLAVGSSELASRTQRIFVYLGGPVAQLLLFGVIVSLKMLGVLEEPRVWNPTRFVVLDILEFVNLVWPLMNLLPVWPLDGGRISQEIFEAVNRRAGLRRSFILSLVTAGLVAVLCALNYLKGGSEAFVPILRQISGPWTILLFGMLAYNSYLMLGQLGPPGRRDEADRMERTPWERDADWWKR